MFKIGLFRGTKALCFSIICVTLFLFPLSLDAKTLESEEKSNNKALVLILDQISTEDMVSAKTPNMDALIDNGGFGIMNVRPQAIINTNRASSYLSLGMGVRATAPERDEWKVNYISGETLIFENVNEIKSGISGKKSNHFGLIGQMLKEQGYKIGLIGNADVNDKMQRESALLIMDKNGEIPSGYSDSFSSDGDVNKLFGQLDLLVIDFGDTVRVQQSGKENLESDLIDAIERADQLLGKIIGEFGFENNLYMVITPNPSPQALREVNLTLTPVIVSNPFDDLKNGILTSSSTRRDGLVTNLNFAPTLLTHFGIQGFGEPIEVVTAANPQQVIAENESLYLNLNKTRYLLHGTYIFLILFILTTMYTEKLGRWNKEKVIYWLGLTILNLPIASFITPLIINYAQVFTGHILILITAFFLAWLSKIFLKNFILSVGISGLLTAILIMSDLFFGVNYLINTPYGFNDVVIGGRFYGINNDLMGILLGSALMGVFALSQYYRIKMVPLALGIGVIMLLIMLALSPLYGANVGGTIGAAVIMIVALSIILKFKLTVARLLLIIALVFIWEIFIAALDAVLNENLTHAGLLFQAVKNQGLIAFLDMIKVKLSQVGLMLILPPWNLVLFFQCYILWKLFYKNHDNIKSFKGQFNIFYQGIIVVILGSAIIFAFNDTGVISSAIMLTYMLVPLGYLLEFHSRGEHPNCT